MAISLAASTEQVWARDNPLYHVVQERTTAVCELPELSCPAESGSRYLTVGGLSCEFHSSQSDFVSL
jgi:hypothetical protein